ncbi:Feline leukemia virus subgroup C cellular receptor [Parelaphostrongylus tenuis]|uniref:Feline leukemia virus subgroup C cellular receptor n=1 Tax=Parelaphostrongylus tenuis TaxID=148309 RepID=A0AAD5QHI6_PARTN|nr:Feline leukemia virus subgroup C cellular receptor [Parelaphostrongylus tenuis]
MRHQPEHISVISQATNQYRAHDPVIIELKEGGFWIPFIGQTSVGASQMFTLGIPSRLAALDTAVGFLVPPTLVSNGTVDELASDLSTLFLRSATLNTAILTVTLFCGFRIIFE